MTVLGRYEAHRGLLFLRENSAHRGLLFLRERYTLRREVPVLPAQAGPETGLLPVSLLADSSAIVSLISEINVRKVPVLGPGPALSSFSRFTVGQLFLLTLYQL